MESNRAVDIHLLDLRYAHTRVVKPSAFRRLQNSIETYGQIVPALVVEDTEKRLVLIDGYLRIRALVACGRDQVLINLLDDNEQNAMFSLLNKSSERQWEAIEQAVLIQEMHHRFGCSLGLIANRLGRDKSWVKRRLDLVEALPEDILKAVVSGKLSPWAASRVMAPLARANASDAENLMAQLEKAPLSTRDLSRLYEHYKKSNRSVRNRILENPSLFIKALNEKDKNREARNIHDGPEGKWFKDIRMACRVIERLIETIEHACYPKQDALKKKHLQTWIGKVADLALELKRTAGEKEDDHSIEERCDSGNEKDGHVFAQDR